jgi:N-acetylated-alpha-linked acidic dipeptidase
MKGFRGTVPVAVALVCAAALLGFEQASSGAQSELSLLGFAPSRTEAHRELERRLQEVPSARSAEQHLRALTSAPHMAGTPGSRRVAEYIRDQFRRFGLEAELAEYKVWLPHPKEVTVELVAPERQRLGTQEEPHEADADSATRAAVIGFSGYSPSGEVSAPVVYVNYGLAEDYRRLRELGVSVEGKIVLARYGRTFRGVKARVAEENKAAGLILYSDPADDGYVAGDPYPRGPWRPPSAIQRGSIYYGFLYSGDPLTPGVAAKGDVQRLSPEEAPSLPRVPTLPINYRDAEKILRHLGGPRVPRDWQGGLPLTYHTGPGESAVRMKLVMDYQLRSIWNPVGRVRGVQEDEWVVVGNHHDAWVFGAVDPSSGTTVLLETARALGELKRSGWKPQRTIVLAGWDAEEFGLIGSTEWVEEHRAELQRKAVAYINVDSAVSGPNFGASATPSLRAFIREAARAVNDPRTGRSVYEVWRERYERSQPQRATPGVATPGHGEREVPLGILGSGSDFTPFYHHSGIPSLDFGFGGEYGVYHSVYDNFYWMKTWGDPQFLFHETAARLLGVLVLRLAETDVLPFDYATYATEIQRYMRELDDAGTLRGERKFDLKPAVEAAVEFAAAAAAAEKALGALRGKGVEPQRATKVNRALVQVEQALLVPEGLTGRPWYKHAIFAPGSYTGYSAVVLPGVREAVDRGDWETARREVAALAEALGRAAARLNEVAAAAGN